MCLLAPSPPKSVNCELKKDVFITLEWEEPDLPNGDLSQYRIAVYFTQPSITFSKTFTTGSPVTEYKVEALEPGILILSQYCSNGVCLKVYAALCGKTNP